MSKRKLEAATFEPFETKRIKPNDSVDDSHLSVVDTANGGLDLILINEKGDIIKTTHINADTVYLLKQKNLSAYEHRKTWKLSSNGYVAWNFLHIHSLMGETLSDDDARKLWYERFAANPYDPIVVAHLDDNRLNFNITNLAKIPQTVNLLSKKTKPVKSSSNRFFGTLTYREQKIKTKRVSTENEAMFAIDVTKLKIVPADVREYLLKHAMWRPKNYGDRYESIEKMLSYAKMYEPLVYKKQVVKRESKNTYFAYRSFAEAMEALPDAHAAKIKTVFETPGVVPFDAAIDAIVYYIGSLGREIVFVVEHDFYVNNMMVSKPSMNTLPSGHLQMTVDGKLNLLHLKIMNREIGQSQKDGMRGGHGAGKVLDNRARVLKLLTAAENVSDKGNILLQTAPGLIGVHWNKASCMWKSDIGSFLKRGHNISLGYHKEQSVAASRYAFATANKKEFKKICADMPDDKTRAKYVRACCVAQAFLPVKTA